MPEPDPMTFLVVQNSRDCPPGLLGDYLHNTGHTVLVWAAYLGADVPTGATGAQVLLILGGPQSATDPHVPWFTATKALIAQFRQTGRAVLGICLGHQLIAETLGGTTGPNPAGHTIGVRPMLVPPSVSWLPSADQVMHWNSDVVLELPPGSQVVARTADGAIQAVHYGDRTWGIQGHPEAGLDVITRWVADDQDAQRLAQAGIDVSVVAAECARVAPDLQRYATDFGAALCVEVAHSNSIR